MDNEELQILIEQIRNELRTEMQEIVKNSELDYILDELNKDIYFLQKTAADQETLIEQQNKEIHFLKNSIACLVRNIDAHKNKLRWALRED